MQVDWDLLKKIIGVFVQMGYIKPDIIKQDNDFVWTSDKNSQIYEQIFERELIRRVTN